MAFKIRLAQPQDKDDILSVIQNTKAGWDKKYAKRSYDEYFSRNHNEDEVVYVGTLNNKIVGVIGYYLDKYDTPQYWLGWFYVTGREQGHGYGNKLFQYVIKELKKKDVKRLFVYTSTDKAYLDAIVFYLRNGFKLESVIRGYYGEEEDQIILSKKIT